MCSSDLTSSIIVLRIHDRAHKKNNFNFNDRFNYRINLNPGWNKVSINLSEVRNAPINREMNMKKMAGLMFFKLKLKTSETVYFSEIELIK